MPNFKELIKSPHIRIALAAGFSIIVMAFVSKRLLSEPLAYLELAIPPFIATIFESVLSKYKDAKFCKTWYWVAAILGSTALIIILHLFKN